MLNVNPKEALNAKRMKRAAQDYAKARDWAWRPPVRSVVRVIPNVKPEDLLRQLEQMAQSAKRG